MTAEPKPMDIMRIRAVVSGVALIYVEGKCEFDILDEMASMAVDRRCERTGKPCGTETWAVGHPCPCDSCQAYLASMEIPSDG